MTRLILAILLALVIPAAAHDSPGHHHRTFALSAPLFSPKCYPINTMEWNYSKRKYVTTPLCECAEPRPYVYQGKCLSSVEFGIATRWKEK
jgi:hypothetical protein